MIGFAALGVSVIGGAAYGAFHRNSPIFGRALGKIESSRKVVALTFDDGVRLDRNAMPELRARIDNRPWMNARCKRDRFRRKSQDDLLERFRRI